jgi:hypothetical protein
MKLRARVEKLLQTIGDLPPPGQLEMVVAVPVGCDMADGQGPGVYFNADGRVATVVFAGKEPDPAVFAGLKARLAPGGMSVVSHPE